MTKIIAGQPIPEFSVEDIKGKVQTQQNYIGQKWMLSFFRYASCPACNLRIHELTKVYDELQEKGLSILAVFESPKESISQYVGKNDLPFPIIPDPDRNLYKQFGVDSSWIKFVLGAPTVMKALLNGIFPGKMEGDLAMVPADFLIDEDGSIHTAYYGKNIGDHIPIEQIKSFIGVRK